MYDHSWNNNEKNEKQNQTPLPRSPDQTLCHRPSDNLPLCRSSQRTTFCRPSDQSPYAPPSISSAYTEKGFQVRFKSRNLLRVSCMLQNPF